MNFSAQQGIYYDNTGELNFPERLPQLEVTNNYNLYFLNYRSQITSLSVYGASIIGIFVLSLAIEMLSFLKWYMIVRKRITSNCLNSLVLDLHKDEMTVKAEQRKIRLTVCERIVVTIIHFMGKALHLIIIYLIMATYNIGYIIDTSAGMMMGNLVFGLIKDTMVINRVKQEKKEMEATRKDQVDILKRRKSTVIGKHHGGAAVDTDRDFLGTE